MKDCKVTTTGPGREGIDDLEYRREGFKPRLKTDIPPPEDFNYHFREAERCAVELKPVRFAMELWIETPLFGYKHPRDAAIKKEETSKS
nr:hypothetical protein [Candidatus Njordarchaeota archaeon]